MTSFPGGSDSKESACDEDTWVLSLGQEDPPEKGMATHSSALDDSKHDQRMISHLISAIKSRDHYMIVM